MALKKAYIIHNDTLSVGVLQLEKDGPRIEIGPKSKVFSSKYPVSMTSELYLVETYREENTFNTANNIARKLDARRAAKEETEESTASDKGGK